METLDDAIRLICDLKGEAIANQALMTALLAALPAYAVAAVRAKFDEEREIAGTMLLNEARVGEATIEGFQRVTETWSSTMARLSR